MLFLDESTLYDPEYMKCAKCTTHLRNNLDKFLSKVKSLMGHPVAVVLAVMLS